LVYQEQTGPTYIFQDKREREKKINRRQTISLLPTSATSGGRGSGDSSNNKVE